jgi:alkyldihydroxyacetonephosphate synthase
MAMSIDRPVEAWMDLVLQCARDNGGMVDDARRTDPDSRRKGLVGAWRHAFVRMPWYREALTPLGILSSTFETAIIW